jgi:hypothetical protein
MNPFLFGILGVVFQGVGLVSFMVVSRTNVAAFAKPAVIVLTCLVVCALLWEGVRRAKGVFGLCLLPITLSLGYAISFHLAGFIGFPGLLSDAREDLLGYFLSVLHVTFFLFVVYAVGTVLFFGIIWGLRKSRLHSSRQSQSGS